MVLTVRQRGQLLAHADEVIDDVVATVWFDGDEATGSWGGIVEPAIAGSLLRAQVMAGQTHYRLQLEDGRAGLVTLGLSEFEADGAQPLTFAGSGALGRK
jgi:hypothetical protein